VIPYGKHACSSEMDFHYEIIRSHEKHEINTEKTFNARTANR